LIGAAYAAVEGWIIIITGVYEEAQDDDIHDKFAEFVRVSPHDPAATSIEERPCSLTHSMIGPDSQPPAPARPSNRLRQGTHIAPTYWSLFQATDTRDDCSIAWLLVLQPKGYALVEYETAEEAQAAIDGANGSKFMGKDIAVDWAFSKAPRKGRIGPPRRTYATTTLARLLALMMQCNLIQSMHSLTWCIRLVVVVADRSNSAKGREASVHKQATTRTHTRIP